MENSIQTGLSAPACASCGSHNLHSREATEEFPYGRGKSEVLLTANVSIFQCANCGFEFTGVEAEQARHSAVCEHLQVMTPVEVKAVRERYGLNRSEMADMSRIGEASLARWESGSHIQSAAYDNYLYLLRFMENVQKLKARWAVAETTSEICPARRFRLISVTENRIAEAKAFSLHRKAA